MALVNRTMLLRVSMRLTVRSLLLLFALLVVTGCSTRFIYDKLDSLIVWKVGDYVTLTSPQKDELKQRLGNQLEYVRVNELPRTAAIIGRLVEDVESAAVTEQQLDERYQQMIAVYDDFMLGIVPVSEWFLLSLSEEQVAELFANLEELNQEMYEDYSGRTAEERRENRNKSALKVTKRFTGRLSDEQKSLITDSLAQMEDASEQWIEYQRDWQRRFRGLVEDPPPSEQFRAELTTLFVYPRSFHSPEYRATVDANRILFNSMMAELLNGLSQKQRSRAVDKLEGYVELLTKLSQGD